jgi:hypothetical protein
MALKWKNRDVVVLRPVGGMSSWADDLVVVRVLESGEEETVRKGDIVGYTEDPNSEQVKRGEALVGTSRDPSHPAVNADLAQKNLDEYNANLEQKAKDEQKAAQDQNLVAAQSAPVVQTLPFDPKKSTVSNTVAVPAVSKTTKK